MGAINNGISYVSSPALAIVTVLEPDIKKRRMLFPKMSISVQEAKKSGVRKFTSNE